MQTCDNQFPDHRDFSASCVRINHQNHTRPGIEATHIDEQARNALFSSREAVPAKSSLTSLKYVNLH